MEQVILILFVIAITVIIFFSSYFLYKVSPKLSLIPIITSAIITVSLFAIAYSMDGWGALGFVIIGIITGFATLLSSIALLIFHLKKKNNQER